MWRSMLAQSGAIQAMVPTNSITTTTMMMMMNNARSRLVVLRQQGNSSKQALSEYGQRRALHSSLTNWLSEPHPASLSPSTSTSTIGKNNVGRTTSVRNKDLPKVPNTLPYLGAFIIAAITSWAGFTVYATNKEKLSSSIFKSVVGQVKNSIQVQTLLSSPSSTQNQNPTLMVPVLKREMWLGGMCRVKGSVNMMQGRVDLSFKITTPTSERSSSRTSNPQVATVYFTSIRAHKHAPFEILRFLVVNDTTGESVSLLDTSQFTSIDAESGDLV